MVSDYLDDTITVLHVDDDENQLKLTKVFLEKIDTSLKVEISTDPQEALERHRQEGFDCIVSDFVMPEMDGIDLASRIRETSDVPFILYTGRGSEEVAERAFATGIDDYIRKEQDPSHYQVLLKRIKMAVEKRKAETELTTSEENYRNVVENANQGIVVTQDGILEFVNHRVLEITGYDEEELLFKPFTHFLHPEDLEIALESYKSQLKGDYNDDDFYPFRIIAKDGEVRWIEINGIGINWNGRMAMLHFLTDVTDQRQAEETIREREELFRALAEKSPNMIFIQKRDRIVYVNEECVRIVGYSKEEFYAPGFDIRTVIASELHDELRENQIRHFRGEEVPQQEYTLLKKDGERVEAIISTKLINYGGDTCILGVATDISERREMEKLLIDSEERYRTLFETSPLAISTHDLEGNITSVNAAFTELTGFTQEEVLGMSFSQIASELDAGEIKIDLIRDSYIALMRNGVVPPFEFSFRRKDGADRWGEAHVSVQKVDGERAGIQVLLLDTTDRRRMEEEHERYQERLEALHRHASDLAEAETVEDIALRTFDAIEQVLGFDVGGFAIVDPPVLRLVYIKGLDYEEGYQIPLDGRGITVRCVLTGETQLVPDVRLSADYHPGHAEGRYMVLSELAVPIQVDRKIIGVINVESERLDAFTEQDLRLAETLSQHVGSALSHIRHTELLQASEERYRGLLDASRDAVFVLDSEKYLYVNRSAANLLGYDDPGELVGTDAFVHVAPEDRESVKEITLRRQRGEETPSRYNFRLVDKNGVGVDVEAHVSLTEYEGKTVSLSVNRDVTGQKRFEEELRRVNRNLEERVKEMRCLFEAIREMQEAASVEELGPKIVELIAAAMYVPEKAAPVLELGGKVFSHPRYREGLHLSPRVEIRNVGVVVGKIYIYFTEDSPCFPAEKQGMINALAESLGGWYEGVRDANKLIEYTGRLEGMVEEKTNELLDAERMVTAGRIAAMVGHDLRSPLQTIKSALYLIKKAPEEAEEMIELIEGSVDRAREMLEELRIQTRDTPLRLELLDLSEQIRTAVQGANIPPGIHLTLEFDVDLESTLLDGTKIRRVLDNLIKNAVEAMPDGGELIVSAGKTDDGIVVSVIDTGVGIAEDERERLFKSFHTTKKNGLGLGLSYCKRAVEAHGGRITVKSEVGRGTMFTVFLPDHKERSPADEAAPELDAAGEAPLQREQAR